MSVKKVIALYRAITNAGFKLTNAKSMETHDGEAWSFVLAHNRVKVASIYDAGRGGEVDVHQLLDNNVSRLSTEPLAPYIAKLFDIPEVAASIKQHDIELVEMDLEYGPQRTFREESATNPALTLEEVIGRYKKAVDEKIAAIKAGPARSDIDAFTMICAELGDAHETIKQMKRVVKSKLAWFITTSETDYMVARVGDTPAARHSVQHGKNAATFDGFIADAIAGL